MRLPVVVHPTADPVGESADSSENGPSPATETPPGGVGSVHQGSCVTHPYCAERLRLSSYNDAPSSGSQAHCSQQGVPVVIEPLESVEDTVSDQVPLRPAPWRRTPTASFLHDVEILPTQPEVVHVVDGIPDVGVCQLPRPPDGVLASMLRTPTVAEKSGGVSGSEVGWVQGGDWTKTGVKPPRPSHTCSRPPATLGSADSVKYFSTHHRRAAAFAKHKAWHCHRQRALPASRRAISRWICSKCHTAVGTRYELREHSRLCTGPIEGASEPPSKRAYVCRTCGKVCPYPSALRVHEEMHVLKYACPVCGTAFRRFYDMTKHLRSDHAGTGQHECKECGRFFKSGTLLFRHKADDLCIGSLLCTRLPDVDKLK